MSNNPTLSIVTPTLGKFSDFWLEQLLKVKGDVRFILVYPPNIPVKSIADPRMKIIVSPFKGELMQRFIGLLNVNSEYVIALDDDDFIHPNIVELQKKYFARFPENWLLRLAKKNIDIENEEQIKKDWEDIPNIDDFNIDKKTPENPYPYNNGNFKGLLEVPIAPLKNKIDILLFLPKRERKDMNGIHIENFNNKIWKTDLVKLALVDLSKAMKILGVIKWIPSWSLDRLLGLFIQAKFFEIDKIVGHRLPDLPEQIRFIGRPDSVKSIRFYFSGDLLLSKQFPEYSYFWNLTFWHLRKLPYLWIKLILRSHSSNSKPEKQEIIDKRLMRP